VNAAVARLSIDPIRYTAGSDPRTRT